MQKTTVDMDKPSTLLNISCLLAPVAFVFLVPTIVVLFLWPFLKPEATMLVVPFLAVGALATGTIKGIKMLKGASSQKAKSAAIHFLIGVNLGWAYIAVIAASPLWL